MQNLKIDSNVLGVDTSQQKVNDRIGQIVENVNVGPEENENVIHGEPFADLHDPVGDPIVQNRKHKGDLKPPVFTNDKGPKTYEDVLKSVLTTGTCSSLSGFFSLFTRAKNMDRLCGGVVDLRRQLLRLMTGAAMSGIAEKVTFGKYTVVLSLNAEKQLMVSAQNAKGENEIDLLRLVGEDGNPLTPQALLKRIDDDILSPSGFTHFNSAVVAPKVVDGLRSMLMAFGADDERREEAVSFAVKFCRRAIVQRLGEAAVRGVDFKSLPPLYVCLLAEDVMAGRLTKANFAANANAGNPARLYPEGVSKMATAQTNAVELADAQGDGDGEKRTAAAVRNLAADLVSSANGWIYDGPQGKDEKLRLADVVGRHGDILKQISKKPSLLDAVKCPPFLKEPLVSLVLALARKTDATNASKAFQKAFADYGAQLERDLIGVFEKASGGDREGTLSGAYGKFFARAVGIYFKSIDPRDRRMMIASSLRYAETDKGALGAFLKGAGPILQKFIQGLPADFKAPELGTAIEDMKSRLAPICDEYVKARLQKIVDDSKSSAKPIAHIKMEKVFGCATVGETMLCSVTYADKTTAKVVLKMQRPEAKNRALRERDVFLEALREFPGLRGNVRGQLDQIMTELDFRREAQNIKTCMPIYGTGNLAEKHVTMNTVVPGFGGSSDVLALTLAEGASVDRFLNDMTQEIKPLLNELFRTNEHGDLVFSGDNAVFSCGKCVDPWRHLGVYREKVRAVLAKLAECYALLQEYGYAWMQEVCFGNEGVAQYDPHLGNFIFKPASDGKPACLTSVDYGNVGKNGEYQNTVLGLTLQAMANTPSHFLLVLLKGANKGKKFDSEVVEYRVIERLMYEQELKVISRQEEKCREIQRELDDNKAALEKFTTRHPNGYAKECRKLFEEGIKQGVKPPYGLVARESFRVGRELNSRNFFFSNDDDDEFFQDPDEEMMRKAELKEKQLVFEDFLTLCRDGESLPKKLEKSKAELDRLKQVHKAAAENVTKNLADEESRISKVCGEDEDLRQILKAEYDETYAHVKEAVDKLDLLVGSSKSAVTTKLARSIQYLRDAGVPLPQELFNVSQALSRLEISLCQIAQCVNRVSSQYVCNEEHEELMKTNVSELDVEAQFRKVTAFASVPTYSVERLLRDFSWQTKEERDNRVASLMLDFGVELESVPSNNSLVKQYKLPGDDEISIDPRSFENIQYVGYFCKGMGALIMQDPEVGKLYDKFIGDGTRFLKIEDKDKAAREYGLALKGFCSALAERQRNKVDEIVAKFARPLQAGEKVPEGMNSYRTGDGKTYVYGAEEMKVLKALFPADPKKTSKPAWSPLVPPKVPHYMETLGRVFNENKFKTLLKGAALSASVGMDVVNNTMHKLGVTKESINAFRKG